MIHPGLIQARLTLLHRVSEPEALAALLPHARRSPEEKAVSQTASEELITRLRSEDEAGLVEQFMQEYRLGSDEGIALLSLAEAYLRIPDTETANALIRDKTVSADWSAHQGEASSLMVNAATFGLALAKALNAPDASPFKRILARGGEPLLRAGIAAAMQLMGGQFVLGRTIGEALDRAHDDRLLCSFDMLGEAAWTADDADRYCRAYAEAIAVAGKDRPNALLAKRHSVSVKLSALHPRYEEAQAAHVVPVLAERLEALARSAAEYGIGLTVDAEEADRLELSLDIIGQVATAPALAGWDGLGLAIQAYQKRAPAVIEWADALGVATGRKLGVRLVKGAYWDTEIKRAQEQGVVDYPVYTRKEATDVSFLACARKMLEARHIAPAFATHNAVTLTTLLQWTGARADVEFQRLHGMGEQLYALALGNRPQRVRVYAPVGGYRDLLAYLVRRLVENGANSSFVHQFGERNVSVADIVADPVDLVEASGGKPHPLIPLPAALFEPERRNSKGLDLSDRSTVHALADAMRAAWAQPVHATPLVDGKAGGGSGRPLRDPADPSRTVGKVSEASRADAVQAVDIASLAADEWASRTVNSRAACLEKMADLLERDQAHLMALAVREAGKTVADALAEVREAVDFCRYYAVEARRQFATWPLPGPTGERNELTLAGRGVFACISPWNFPLSIFTGQVAAALVTGNAVVAKPAPQTPLIAFTAMQLFHESGVPRDVLHFLPGGPVIGRALVSNPKVAGVAFTGSTATARSIAHTLLEDDHRPLVPLIAETGGINAMIVDSTALPEQVVADVITSAFRSAGQRCSALRLLCLQEDIAETVLKMLTGAMDQLRIGDPADLATDIGPLIDADAKERILSYLEDNKSRIIHQLSTDGTPGGHFVGPALLGIDRPEDLSSEVFGPVLHVTTWKAGTLAELVERINAGGYGLTMGLHSRLEEAADIMRAHARVGNLYINRSMIGAVVGAQPFGGEGLSGTGPKAGGPHYLTRFAVERSVSVNTTSTGGNATLLSL